MNYSCYPLQRCYWRLQIAKRSVMVDRGASQRLMATKCNETEPEFRIILTWDNLAVCKRYFGIQARLFPFNHLETLATYTHEMDTHHTIQPLCHVRTQNFYDVVGFDPKEVYALR